MSSTLNNKESRTAALIKGTVTIGIYEVFVLITGFVVPKIMLTYYGSEVNGLVTSITQFLNYISLIEAGLTTSLIYSLYRFLAENCKDGINSVFSAGWKYYNKVGYACLILVVVLSILYPLILSTKKVSKWEIFGVVLVMGFSTTLNFFLLGKYNIIVTADKKIYIYNIAKTVYTIIFTVVIVLTAVLGGSILLARTLVLIPTLVQMFIMIWYVKRHYPFLDHRMAPDLSAISRRGDAFAQELASTVQFSAPAVILTLVSRDLRIVSIFSIFNVVINGIMSMISLFGPGLTAIFGEMIAGNETNTLQRTYKEFDTLFSIISSIVFSVSFVMIMPFIRIYTASVNDVNYNLPIVGFLAVANCLIYTIQSPLKTLVKSAGLFKETRYRAIAQTLICIVSGTVLCIRLNVYGVLIGLLLSNLYRCVDLLFYAHKYITKLKFTVSLKRWGVLFANILSIAVVSRALKINPKSYSGWALAAFYLTVVATIIAFASYWMICRDDMKQIFRRFSTLAKKRSTMKKR